MKMNKKGITLVEVIVVLIIMAVLAGVLVASYTGYIDKANDDKALVEARAAYLALSTTYHELYAGSYTPSAAADLDVDGDSNADICKADVLKLAGLTTGTIESASVSNGQVTAMVFKTGTVTCTLAGGVWSVQ